MSIESSLEQNGTPSFLSGLNASTYYKVLNVAPNATKLMIRESYLRLKNMYQSGGEGLYGLSDGLDISAQAAELEEAFSVLNDEYKRAQYDRSIGLRGPIHGATVNDHGAIPETPNSDTIQTSRSTLKVTRTRALRSDDKAVQEAMNNLLAESDHGDGATLAKLRQILNVSEAEIQERTKISLEYIRSMESNRFERLPQAVYVKGFMRSYLRYLCVPNPESIIKAFAARLEAWQQGVRQ